MKNTPEATIKCVLVHKYVTTPLSSLALCYPYLHPSLAVILGREMSHAAYKMALRSLRTLI